MAQMPRLFCNTCKKTTIHNPQGVFASCRRCQTQRRQ